MDNSDVTSTSLFRQSGSAFPVLQLFKYTDVACHTDAGGTIHYTVQCVRHTVTQVERNVDGVLAETVIREYLKSACHESVQGRLRHINDGANAP